MTTQPSSPETVELLPCPFCGGKAAFGEIDDPDHPEHGGKFIACENIRCTACVGLMFSLKDDCKPQLAERWNSRPAQSSRDTVIEECARVADGWLAAYGSNEIQYTSAREYACDAVADVADAIRGLAAPSVSSTERKEAES